MIMSTKAKRGIQIKLSAYKRNFSSIYNLELYSYTVLTLLLSNRETFYTFFTPKFSIKNAPPFWSKKFLFLHHPSPHPSVSNSRPGKKTKGYKKSVFKLFLSSTSFSSFQISCVSRLSRVSIKFKRCRHKVYTFFNFDSLSIINTVLDLLFNCIKLELDFKTGTGQTLYLISSPR